MGRRVRQGSRPEGERGCLPSHRRRPGNRPPVQGAERLPCDEGLRRSIIAGSRDRRLSLMRRLASLSRDSRSRRASIARLPGSSAFISSSPLDWRLLPAPRRASRLYTLSEELTPHCHRMWLDYHRNAIFICYTFQPTNPARCTGKDWLGLRQTATNTFADGRAGVSAAMRSELRPVFAGNEPIPGR